MLSRTALLALCAAAIAAASTSASPIIVRDSPVTIPIARRMNLTGIPTLRAADRVRIQQLAARTQSAGALAAAGFDVSATNGVVDYTASIGVGTPATSYDLLIDTGSSNTWVGADKAYVKTSSSVNTGQEFVRPVAAFCLIAPSLRRAAAGSLVRLRTRLRSVRLSVIWHASAEIS